MNQTGESKKKKGLTAIFAGGGKMEDAMNTLRDEFERGLIDAFVYGNEGYKLVDGNWVLMSQGEIDSVLSEAGFQSSFEVKERGVNIFD